MVWFNPDSLPRQQCCGNPPLAKNIYPDPSNTIFSFTAASIPTITFHFTTSLSPSSPTGMPSRKRSRCVSDIDGILPPTPGKKKRRLRLHLVTSRLSRPYSQPATNIVDRGASKIAVWAKQKALGRNLLRKAAIMNRVRKQQVEAAEAKEAERQQMEGARRSFLCASQLPNYNYKDLD
jgi:hypothetical protein